MSTTPRVRAGLASLAAAYFVSGTGSLAIVGLLDPMSQAFDVTRTQVAQLVTVFALTFAFAAPLLQVAFGNRSRRRLVIVGLLTMAAAALATVFAPSFEWALAARIVMALGAAAIGPVASALGASLVAPQDQAKALASVFAGLTVSTVLGVPLSSWLGHVLSWQSVFVVFAVVAVLCAFAVARVVRDDSAGTAPTLRALAGVFERASTAWALSATLFQMGAQFATYTLVALLMTEHFHLQASWISLALFLFGVGGIAGNAIAGAVGDRVNTDRLLFGALAALVVAFVALTVAPPWPWLALALGTGWALVGLMFQAPQQKRLVELAPSQRGLLLAMNASAIYFGMSLGSYVGARVHAGWGAGAMPLASIVLALAAAGALALSRRAAAREKETCAQLRLAAAQAGS